MFRSKVIKIKYIRLDNTSKVYKYSTLLIAISYALLLTYLIPMDDGIKDRQNYIVYADSSEFYILQYFSSGLLSLLSNEPVWLFINIVLDFFFEPEVTLRIIILFSSLVSSILILRVNPKYFYFLILILLFPEVIGKYVVLVRQGLAISLFLIGWFSSSKALRWILFSITPFIHASFFFVLFLYVLAYFLQYLKFSLDVRTFIVVLFGLVISFGLGLITNLVGARQANTYEFSATDVSGMGFIFWIVIFFIYWLQEYSSTKGRSFTKQYSFSMVAIAFYLSTYFLIEVTARIFESTLIVVLLAGIGLTSWRKKVFMALAIAFVVLSWFLRINQPWLGWGTGL